MASNVKCINWKDSIGDLLNVNEVPFQSNDYYYFNASDAFYWRKMRRI